MLQDIRRDSINGRGRSAFWHDRYTLRQAAPNGVGAPAAADEYARNSRLREGSATALDVPTFLDSLKDTILTTGTSATLIAGSLNIHTCQGRCIRMRWWRCTPLGLGRILTLQLVL